MKPPKLLLDEPVKRKTPKSTFLRKLEKMQKPSDEQILNVVPISKRKRK